MEWGTSVKWGRFLLFCVLQSAKTKETNPTRPGSPTPCKQALNALGVFRICDEYYQVDTSHDSAAVGEIMTSLIFGNAVGVHWIEVVFLVLLMF